MFSTSALLHIRPNVTRGPWLALQHRGQYSSISIPNKTTSANSSHVVFCFAGLGYVPLEATRDLFRTSAVFRNSIHDFEDAIASHYTKTRTRRPTISLADYLAESAPRPASVPGFDSSESRDNEPTTPLASHVIQASQYALAHTIQARGIEPSSVVGYSLGEFIAALFTGSLSLSSAIDFQARREALYQDTSLVPEPGGMLTVKAPPSETVRILVQGGAAGDAEVSGYPHPNSTILSGTAKILDRAQEILAEASIDTQRRDMKFGMHSSHVGAVTDRIRERPEDFMPTISSDGREAKVVSGINHWSCLGVKLGADTPLNAKYWATMIRQPIHFTQCVQGIYEEHFNSNEGKELIFLDLGMGPRLSRLIVNSLKEKKEWKEGLIRAIGCVEPMKMDAKTKKNEGWAVEELERKLSVLPSES
ncbi:uncharacterized protein RCC_04966 [Ramularia collo-cygni]|uniref:Malonyl-CoA:ACP transacylase (MAT) domain-containing protein n=1 Tax=Ramularia collo-cygni TaxID=112498 RepID=A0A2D3V0W1_9PEZI|nr:uncharacterized protein RCC_04966 [Ramularia collo-cygni]CZT19120.1 uncharacterized protein RCC_04966 [Ramularia collo-cygni]